MNLFSDPIQIILGILLVLSSLGILLAKKPVHASLSFLLTLFTLAIIYLRLSAEFIAVMQVLVYAGAILVIFMFVVVLFQDAHQLIEMVRPKSSQLLIVFASVSFLLALAFLGRYLIHLPNFSQNLPEGYGTVQSLGRVLYIDFFFPFEAVVFLFLVAVIGALYVGKKVR